MHQATMSRLAYPFMKYSSPACVMSRPVVTMNLSMFISSIKNRLTHALDRRVVISTYERLFGRKLHWNNPMRFTEKVQVFKISDEAERLWPYVDKYEVRSYVKETIGSDYLNSVYHVFDHVDEIDERRLPQSFVLKATHGSGWNIICPDKNLLDWPLAKAQLAKWMNMNYYSACGKERQYKNIKPRIICEKYLTTDEQSLVEYKLMCFHGTVHYIQAMKDKLTPQASSCYYDTHWRPAGFSYTDKKPRPILTIPKPVHLDEIIRIGQKLAAPFDHVRVDLYNAHGKLHFGELTFTSGNGLNTFTPDLFDRVLGKLC